MLKIRLADLERIKHELAIAKYALFAITAEVGGHCASVLALQEEEQSRYDGMPGERQGSGDGQEATASITALGQAYYSLEEIHSFLESINIEHVIYRLTEAAGDSKPAT